MLGNSFRTVQSHIGSTLAALVIHRVTGFLNPVVGVRVTPIAVGAFGNRGTEATGTNAVVMAIVAFGGYVTASFSSGPHESSMAVRASTGERGKLVRRYI